MNLQMRQGFWTLVSWPCTYSGVLMTESKLCLGCSYLLSGRKDCFCAGSRKEGPGTLSFSPATHRKLKEWKAGCFSPAIQRAASPLAWLRQGTLRNSWDGHTSSVRPRHVKRNFFLCSFLPWMCNYEEQLMSLLPLPLSLAWLGLSVSCGHNSLISMVVFEGLLQMKQGAWFC